jgi:hypothetical protein
MASRSGDDVVESAMWLTGLELASHGDVLFRRLEHDFEKAATVFPVGSSSRMGLVISREVESCVT